MEFLLCIVFFALVFGGAHWLFRKFLAARDWTRGYLASHAVAYRLAGAAAFLNGAGTVYAFYLDVHRHGDDFPIAGIVTLGLIVALMTLPLWFAVMLVSGFFYRTFVEPTLEILILLLWPFKALVTAVVRPARRRADSIRCEQAKTEQEQQTRTKKRDQKRRESARSRCEVLYHLHAPEIGKRFTRQMLDDYLRKYMGNDRDPEEVEEWAAQLEALLLGHVERVKPTPKFRSLEDIARWFEEQKRQLHSLPDDRLRQTLLAKLKARYTELTTEFLEEMQA
jgi:hypothetical protein